MIKRLHTDASYAPDLQRLHTKTYECNDYGMAQEQHPVQQDPLAPRGAVMSAQANITKATPCPTLVAGRATKQDQKDWSPELTVIRTCMWCKTVYLDAGRAGLCEHWHEGLL
jgi:hypothetical protein